MKICDKFNFQINIKKCFKVALNQNAIKSAIDTIKWVCTSLQFSNICLTSDRIIIVRSFIIE